jgi:replicative DNA helicase
MDNGQYSFTAENITPPQPKPKRHNARLCPFAVRQRIVNALANGNSIRAIARALRVSNNTVTAIRDTEWQQVATRKSRIAAQAEQIATHAANQLLESVQRGEIKGSALVPVFGVAVDKMTLLRGDPGLTVHHQHYHSRQQELIDAARSLIKSAKVIDVPVPLLSEARDHSEKITRRKERRS